MAIAFGGLVPLLIAIVLMLGSVFFANNSGNKITVQTSSGTELSNNKIEWGIKRGRNGEQPDLGSKNRQLIEKYNGMAMGNKESKNIYVTFDLGYEAGYTENILDILKENNVPAAFFITAHYVNTASDLVQRMIDEGHIIGNHTVNHKSMPSISESELEKELMNLHTAIYEKFNYEMKYMRPPKGEYSERTLNTTVKLGYIPVMWSFAYADWDEAKQPSHQDGIDKIVKNTHNGEIMLLHATSKTNMEILDTVIKQIKELGYEFKSLDEFVK
jgi:peptidoglycan-N-acetylmuramic acid deacetylase